MCACARVRDVCVYACARLRLCVRVCVRVRVRVRVCVREVDACWHVGMLARLSMLLTVNLMLG